MRMSLTDLSPLHQSGTSKGITSVCSAHPLVLRAALRHGRDMGATVLIEATCNQVNHQGGYTGMQPADFARIAGELADLEGCHKETIILGGDHLGPSPWRNLPAEEALSQAEIMVAAYVTAGFRKIHLDASMGCLGEAAALDDATTAKRAARLAQVAEDTANKLGLPSPLYVIGTEVPPPGGAGHALTTIAPTSPKAAQKTIAVHEKTFTDMGLAQALNRVIGLVVQPGVEFDNQNVIYYDPAQARALTSTLKNQTQYVFEAHSTDYQRTTQLAQLVRDGFGILKVGPKLTFALREALYALDLIASDLVPEYGHRPLYTAMEILMTQEPTHWNRHYVGSDAEQRTLRHYSLSDRIRYYWASAPAQAAVTRLFNTVSGRIIPLPLIWQHLPGGDGFADRPLNPEDVIIWRVTQCLKSYHAACAT